MMLTLATPMWRTKTRFGRGDPLNRYWIFDHIFVSEFSAAAHTDFPNRLISRTYTVDAWNRRGRRRTAASLFSIAFLYLCAIPLPTCPLHFDAIFISSIRIDVFFPLFHFECCFHIELVANDGKYGFPLRLHWRAKFWLTLVAIISCTHTYMALRLSRWYLQKHVFHFSSVCTLVSLMFFIFCSCASRTKWKNAVQPHVVWYSDRDWFLYFNQKSFFAIFRRSIHSPCMHGLGLYNFSYRLCLACSRLSLDGSFRFEMHLRSRKIHVLGSCRVGSMFMWVWWMASGEHIDGCVKRRRRLMAIWSLNFRDDFSTTTTIKI